MTTLTLQPDAAAGIDTYLNSSAPNYAAGAETVLFFRASVYTPALLKFNLSSLPNGAIINSGVLSLFVLYTVSACTITVSRILAANSAWTEGGAKWNYATGTTRWAGDAGADGGADAGCSVSGVDYSSTPLGTKILSSGVIAPNEIAIPLTSQAELQAMFAANYGMRVYSTDTGGAVRSSDYYATNPALCPKLVLEYTVPGAGGILQSAVFHSGIFGTSVR